MPKKLRGVPPENTEQPLGWPQSKKAGWNAPAMNSDAKPKRSGKQPFPLSQPSGVKHKTSDIPGAPEIADKDW